MVKVRAAENGSLIISLVFVTAQGVGMDLMFLQHDNHLTDAAERAKCSDHPNRV
jgi:hypothetical protein